MVSLHWHRYTMIYIDSLAAEYMSETFVLISYSYSQSRAAGLWIALPTWHPWLTGAAAAWCTDFSAVDQAIPAVWSCVYCCDLLWKLAVPARFGRLASKPKVLDGAADPLFCNTKLIGVASHLGLCSVGSDFGVAIPPSLSCVRMC